MKSYTSVGGRVEERAGTAMKTGREASFQTDTDPKSIQLILEIKYTQFFLIAEACGKTRQCGSRRRMQ